MGIKKVLSEVLGSMQKSAIAIFQIMYKSIQSVVEIGSKCDERIEEKGVEQRMTP